MKGTHMTTQRKHSVHRFRHGERRAPRAAGALAVAVALISVPSAALSATGPSAEEIIRRADEVRNPSESYSMTVEVTDGEQDSAPARFEVSLKGNDKTLVRTIKPLRDKGRDLLMLGEDMWAYIPNLKRAIRVSLGQKLTGQAANGDISRMRWSGDYDAVIESETPKEWRIAMKARKKGLTYDAVTAWVEKGTYRPLRAEYLTPGGKVLKRARFEDYRTLGGRERPARIVIQDAVRENDVSVIRIEKMKVRDFASSLFHQRNLGK